jgi:hypothetical protein
MVWLGQGVHHGTKISVATNGKSSRFGVDNAGTVPVNPHHSPTTWASLNYNQISLMQAHT